MYLALVVLGPFNVAHSAHTASSPLRSGTVISKTDAGGFTYIKVIDGEGRKFWVLTTLCVVGENARIDVLAGAHYDKVVSDHLEATLEDVYVAQRLRIDDLEVAGFGEPGLPAGCSIVQ